MTRVYFTINMHETHIQHDNKIYKDEKWFFFVVVDFGGHTRIKTFKNKILLKFQRPLSLQKHYEFAIHKL